MIVITTRKKKVLVLCLAGARLLLRPEKKSSSRLSGRCMIVRNLFSSCAIVLCQFLVLVENVGTCSTLFSGGLFWDQAGNSFWCYVRT